MDDDDNYGIEPMICPVTGTMCMTEQDEFCEYGCARKAGIDVDRDEA